MQVSAHINTKISHTGRRPTGAIKCAGFTLLESMVSFLILGIGLLGIAALQGNALRFSNQSYMRSQAVIVAYDIFERMRANPAGVAGGHYVSAADGFIPTDFVDCMAGSCTPEQLAAFDITRWNESVSSLLPSGGASLIATSENEYTVTIYWLEQPESDPGESIAANPTDNSLTVSAVL